MPCALIGGLRDDMSAETLYLFDQCIGPMSFRKQRHQTWLSSSWPRRFMQASFTVNRLMNGLFVDKLNREDWTPKNVDAFITWMRKNCTITEKRLKLYRGTSMPSPRFEKNVLEETKTYQYPDLITRFRHKIPISNLSFLSMTSDKEIAKEFTGSKNVKDFDRGKSGYAHVRDVFFMPSTGIKHLHAANREFD